MKRIDSTVEKLDDTREMFKRFSHFTVGRGKAIYHLLHVPDGTVGYYYAIRFESMNTIGAKRALKPLTKIVCWGE